VAEPGADLGVALAVAGTRRHCALAPDTVAVGEIGLGGELRQVPQVERRLVEAARLGFRAAIGPPSLPSVPGVTALTAATLADALDVAYGSERPMQAVS